MLQDNPGAHNSWCTQVHTVCGNTLSIFPIDLGPYGMRINWLIPLHLQQRCMVTNEASTNPLAGVMRVD